MPDFLVRPKFENLGAVNQITFPIDKINAFTRGDIMDTISFWQNRFKLYGYMRFTKNLTYKLHWLVPSAFVWQRHNSCLWTPTQGLSMGSQEIKPERVKINAERCYDEHFDNAFEAMLSWNGSQAVELNEDGVQFMNELAMMLSKSATLGAISTLTMGRYYDMTVAGVNPTTSNVVESALLKQHDAVGGWMKLFKTLAAQGKAQLDIPNLINAATDIDATGKKYIGNAITLLDAITAATTPEMQTVLSQGAAFYGSDVQVIYKVTPSIYARVRAQWIQQGANPIMQNPRLKSEKVAIGGGNSGSIDIFYLDSIPIVPINETSIYDAQLKGAVHGAYIGLTGNIQLGSSFDALPSLGSGGVALSVQQSKLNTTYGQYTFLAHALMAVGIADTNYEAGTSIYAQKQ